VYLSAYLSWGLRGIAQVVLQADITEFQPYYVQIVAQLLERRADPIPPSYLQLLPSLLQQPLWASRSNQPALARLIKAFLTRAAPQIVANQAVFLQILGLVQFLMMSKVASAGRIDALCLSLVASMRFSLSRSRFHTQSLHLFSCRGRSICSLSSSPLREPCLPALKAGRLGR
jgi:hypothetical protein